VWLRQCRAGWQTCIGQNKSLRAPLPICTHRPGATRSAPALAGRQPAGCRRLGTHQINRVARPLGVKATGRPADRRPGAGWAPLARATRNGNEGAVAAASTTNDRVHDRCCVPPRSGWAAAACGSTVTYGGGAWPRAAGRFDGGARPPPRADSAVVADFCLTYRTYSTRSWTFLFPAIPQGEEGQVKDLFVGLCRWCRKRSMPRDLS